MPAFAVLSLSPTIDLPLYRTVKDEPCARADFLIVTEPDEWLSESDRHKALADASEGCQPAFRAVPMLRIVGDRASRTIVLGRLHVAVERGHVTVIAKIDGAWSETKGWQQVEVDTLSRCDFPDRLFTHAHRLIAEDDQTLVTTVSKAAAEVARDAVAELRQARYDLESKLAASLHDRGEVDTFSILASLFALGSLVGQARDAARSAVRSGLWLHLDDDDAYHRYRRNADPTIIKSIEPADASTRVWMSTHDAAVRQCRAMEEQLAEEVIVLRALLDATATMSVAREADARDRFNKVAGAVALGIGGPSLVLAYYGAGKGLLPLNSLSRSMALVPIVISCFLAAMLAREHLPGRPRSRNSVRVFGFVALLLVPLIVAGVLANWMPV